MTHMPDLDPLDPAAEIPWSREDSQELSLEFWGLQGDYTFRWDVPPAESVRALIEQQQRPALRQATLNAASLTPDGRAALGEWIATTRDLPEREQRDVQLATYFFNPESSMVEGRRVEAGDLEAEAISAHLSDMVNSWFLSQIDQRWHDEQRAREDAREEDRQSVVERGSTLDLETAAPWRQGLSRLEMDVMEADWDARSGSRFGGQGLGQ